MGYLFEYLSIQRFTELEHSFLMAGRTKIPAFTGKWQEIFMLAVITLDPGKTQMEVTTVQIFVYDVQYIWMPILLMPS